VGPAPTHGPETAALPPSKPGEVHVQVEAPFVFRATDMVAKPAPAPVKQAQAINMYPRDLRAPSSALPPGPQELAQSEPPPTPAMSAQEHRGFFGHIKGFLTAMFR
jgi:hypothetical protein